MSMEVSWTPPEPRKGVMGAWDKFVGPGTTAAESWLQLGGAVLLTAVIAFLTISKRQALDWSPLQIIVAVFLAFDIVGGIVTNATAAAKRWYHRPGQSVTQHVGFVALHALHLFVIAWLFRGMDWGYFGFFYGYLLVASLLILETPHYLQRPLALLLYSGALLINSYFLTPTAGLEWFIPLFFLKLLVSHLLKEAPFYSDSDDKFAE